MVLRELDLHECFLDEAKVEIRDEVEECAIKGEADILLIHGYAHGNAIKNWIHSKDLVRELQKVNVRVLSCVFVPGNEGATHLRFELIE